MNTNYEAALEKSRIASRAFGQVQADYRSRKIGDSEYLAGRKTYEAAMSEYDVAFADESELE